MRQARTVRLIAGVAAAAMVLAACSSNSNSGDGSGQSTTPPASTTQSQTGPATTAGSDTGSATSPATDTGAATESGSGTATATGGGGGATTPALPTMTGDPSTVKVGLAYDVGGRGDQSFNDSAAEGLDMAKAKGVTVVGELEATNGEPDQAKADRLNQLISSGATDVIAVGFAYATPLGPVAKANPKIHFAIVDDNSLCTKTATSEPLPNVDCMNFAAEQSSFLVGVAAALKTKTGKVGFIGGVDVPLLQTFQAGFDAGVKAAKSDAQIVDKYITEPPDFGGFNDPGKGETIAKGMYGDGADVIYAAAGGSGAGVFKAAKAAGTWGIGVDSDQYKQSALANVKDVILTSAVKNVNVGVYTFITAAVNGTPLTGNQDYDLANGGVGISTSGGFIDDIMPQIDDYAAKIISGAIKVPTTLNK